MKTTRFTDEQIIGFLKQAQAGMAIKDICRSGGFSPQTFYKWRSRFGGMVSSDAAKLRDLEAENNKIKKTAGRGAPGHSRAQKRLWGKALAPQVKREAITQMIKTHLLSERRACCLVGLSRDSFRHPPQRDALT